MTAGAPGSAGYILVVTDRACEASDVLFFEHVVPRMPDALRVVRTGVDRLADGLAGATAVVIVRSLIELRHVSGCARRLGVPCYYFLDDNFMLLRDEPDPYATWFAGYSTGGVRAALQDFEGVLLATPALMDYCRAHQLHERLSFYPPVAGHRAVRADASASRPLTLAFFGGTHRRDAFVQFVYPAIRRAADARDIVLVAVGVDRALAPPLGRLQVVHQPYNPSYTDALASVARHGIDILVHPGSQSVNNPYKNPHVLINAWMLGAAPIFSNLPPYDAVAGDGVAILCENTVDDWSRAIATLAGNPAARRDIAERLSAYCSAHFGGHVNEQVLASILKAHRAPIASQHRGRRLRAAVCLGVSRATGLARRAVRRASRKRAPAGRA